jgi:4,5-DOPA dioxygenase extradiol
MYADLRTERADAEIAAGHPFGVHLRHAADLENATPHRAWSPVDGPLPALYLSHGAPMLFEMPDWMTQLHTWARALPKPTGIVIVSAHWEQAPLSLSVSTPADLVYDFGGFDPMYYRMRYDTPDASDLAVRVRALMPDTESVHQHVSRGLDHGAWVPLKIMYPDGDIPVLQVSMPTHDPDRLMSLGARLRDLRSDGVLVIGSGYMTHGLPFIDWSQPDVVPGWSSDFDLWAAETLGRGDIETLANFKQNAPGMPYAHPTVEHFTPLFVTLGAAADPTAAPTTRIDGYAIGLAKRSVEVV